MKKTFVLIFLILVCTSAALSQNNEIQSIYNKFEDETSIIGKSFLLNAETSSLENKVYPFLIFKGNKTPKLTDDFPVFLFFSFFSPNDMKYETSNLSGEMIFLLNNNERLRFPIRFIDTSPSKHNNVVIQRYAVKLEAGSLRRMSKSESIEVRWAKWYDYSFNQTIRSSFADFLTYLEK